MITGLAYILRIFRAIGQFESCYAGCSGRAAIRRCVQSDLPSYPRRGSDRTCLRIYGHFKLRQALNRQLDVVRSVCDLIKTDNELGKESSTGDYVRLIRAYKTEK